ncbi:S-adenosyl-L-methionine-dependent methyltransferase [Geopyxis carbonaria]|nr:S-adenosyl-L-methionine-dependent methyltransferase [Geopyxis carbonaria]
MSDLRSILTTTFLRPLTLLFLALLFLPLTLLYHLFTLNLTPLTSWSSFRDTWFTSFWSLAGAASVSSDTIHLRPLLSACRGVVLDLGPATGLTVPLLPAAQIGRVIAVEPNTTCHHALTAAYATAGIEARVTAAGAEDLDAAGVAEGSVDVVLAVKVLCSVPRPEEVVRALYKTLKPGGKMVVFEHVRNREVAWVGAWQQVLRPVWSACLGGCDITRDTGKWVEEAGEWEKIEWRVVQGQGKWDAVPFVMGVAVKKV